VACRTITASKAIGPTGLNPVASGATDPYLSLQYKICTWRYGQLSLGTSFRKTSSDLISNRRNINSTGARRKYSKNRISVLYACFHVHFRVLTNKRREMWLAVVSDQRCVSDCVKADHRRISVPETVAAAWRRLCFARGHCCIWPQVACCRRLVVSAHRSDTVIHPGSRFQQRDPEWQYNGPVKLSRSLVCTFG
jgi:hypothetical protein